MDLIPQAAPVAGQEDKDPYYFRSEVSNSDLSALKKMIYPKKDELSAEELERAYAFGTLLDCLVTESHKVNLFKRTIGRRLYTPEEIDLALAMKKSLYRDAFFLQLAKQCSFQKITIRERFVIEHDGFTFCLPARCKWDLFVEGVDLGGDLKSTTAETQKQFEEACYHFDYPRQRAWYMDLENRSNDVLIGVSKKNLQVFKLPIRRGDTFYNHGRKQYQELAFEYWKYFGDLKMIA